VGIGDVVVAALPHGEVGAGNAEGGGRLGLGQPGGAPGGGEAAAEGGGARDMQAHPGQGFLAFLGVRAAASRHPLPPHELSGDDFL